MRRLVLLPLWVLYGRTQLTILPTIGPWVIEFYLLVIAWILDGGLSHDGDYWKE